MKDHQYPRNLRRSVGSQPVVCVGRSSWPEAGIAALVIPAQSSRWTVRGQGDVHCRLADLPTCRPADLPTCRPAHLPTCRPADLPNLVVDDNWGAGSRTLLRPQLRRFLYLQYQRRGFRLNLRLQNTTSPPWLEEPSKRLLRCHSFESSCGRHIPFPLKTARNQKIN